ncbi:TetR/AcrR family transcriptional regulator [Amycolatopsis rhizosphaerae]|uniref:TetR/AcrR family transcriptional regulator n=1 Tax=Amycolatopsis rhizosphaerae TaxID=2053003 RepID=A0A558CXB7_9PSEU|nr:TetR/AcrR family transcriptional regulator [Amycolatopsis rhizosphaerae]TVT53411.1 TetR/AcrR family transcriptional regulator [Amycolatopsis rhizosphaerae]
MFSEHVQSRAARREATRQRVLAAAERLFRDQGFGATTVRQIAAEAGVSAGTVMSVGDKDALLVAIFDGWIDAVHRARTAEHGAAPVPMSPGAAVDAVMALFEPFIRYFTLDEELSREYAAIIVRGAHESAIFQNLALSLIAEITGVLARAGLDGAGSGRGARVVYFSYLGILMTISHGTIRRPDAVDQLREVIGFVIGHEGGEE